MFVCYVKLLGVVFIGFWGVAKGVLLVDVFFEMLYSCCDFVCWFCPESKYLDGTGWKLFALCIVQ